MCISGHKWRHFLKTSCFLVEMLLFQFLYAIVDILGKGSFIFIDHWILNFH